MKRIHSHTAFWLIAALSLVGCSGETPTGQEPPATDPAFILLTPTTLDLVPSQSHALIADVRDAQFRRIPAEIEWSSDNPAVASVSPTGGLVTGVGPGTANVTARAGAAVGRAEITVVSAESFVLAYTEIDVVVGPEKQYIATANLAMYREEGIHRFSLGTAGHAFATPAWSPDGRQVAVMLIRGTLGEQLGEPGLGSRPFETASDILILAVGDGSPSLAITTDGWNRFPDWSPDGRFIVYVSGEPGQNQIRIAEVATGAEVQLTTATGNFRTPRWSPDGSRIAFTATVEYQDDIFVMNRDGGDIVNLTADPGHDASPTWSPDGKKIAFSSSRIGPLNDIFVMDVDSRVVRRLTAAHAQNESYEQPAWAPDGTRIAFSLISLWGSSGLFAIHPDGTGLSRLTAPGSGYPDYFPAWRRVGN